MNLSQFALPLIFSILAGFAIFVAITSTGRARTRPGNTPGLIRIFSPLVGRLLRRRGGWARLKRELLWVDSSYSPEVYVVLPFVLAPGLGLIFLAAGLMVGAGLTLAAILGGLGLVIGYLYPQSSIKRTLHKRAAAIHEDVPIFVAAYARLASTRRISRQQVLNEMYNMVTEERARSAARAETTGRTAGSGPYDSDLWRGLERLIETPQGRDLVRRNATMEDPDSLTEFALWCDDRDMSLFLNGQRRAEIDSRDIDADQLDTEMAELRHARIEEIRNSFGRLQNEVMLYMVAIGFPMLFLVILAPLLIPLIVGN